MILQKPIVHCFDLPPTMDKVQNAVKQTTSGKAPGMDGLPAEVYKEAGPVTLETFH